MACLPFDAGCVRRLFFEGRSRPRQLFHHVSAPFHGSGAVRSTDPATRPQATPRHRGGNQRQGEQAALTPHRDPLARPRAHLVHDELLARRISA